MRGNLEDKKMSKVIVGLTSIPPRFESLHVTLDSLHNQTPKPDKIYLYIADYYERFKQKVTLESLPKFLFDYDLLEIKTGKDYGPISKLFVSLQNETDDDSIIVTCDDDLIYDNGWLDALICNSNRLPDKAVGYRGRVLGRTLTYQRTKCISTNRLPNDTAVDIVTAVRGWAYKRKFFHADYILEWEKTRKKHPYIFFNDDIWISGTLEQVNIEKILFANTPVRSHNLKLESSLIKSEGQSTKTNKQIDLFKKYWKRGKSQNV